MAQVIRLRNVPTPVLDVTYTQVTYPNFMYGGSISNMVPNREELNPLRLEELQKSTGPIVNTINNIKYEESTFIEAELSNVTVDLRTF